MQVHDTPKLKLPQLSNTIFTPSKGSKLDLHHMVRLLSFATSFYLLKVKEDYLLVTTSCQVLA